MLTEARGPALKAPAGTAVVPVVLCGGGGERLWPLSRSAVPKHLLRFAGNAPLLERTLGRIRNSPSFGPTALVLCNETDRHQVKDQVDAVLGPGGRVLVEPVRRDSAAAVALAVAAVYDADPDAVMAVLPADHVIADVAAFDAAIAAAAGVARLGRIVTFGIEPDEPSSQYGYLQTGAPIAGTGASVVERFVEKPKRETAEALLAAAGTFWNSGIFVFTAGTMREALLASLPAAWEAASAAWASRRQDGDLIRFDRDTFAAAPRTSIDFAVMEKAGNLAVIPARFDWSDVGLWPAVAQMLPADAAGNRSWGRTAIADSRNSIVYSDTDMLVATAGVDGLLVAVTADAVLVCPKERTADLKALVAELRARGHAEADQHLTVHRPWGRYQPVARGDRYQVKRIVVRPGGILSLQKHHHRAEHWVVVKGTAQVTIGDEVRVLSENQSTYIPLGVYHRLENPGVIDLELVEVQTGTYLGEDDIVRVEDIYGRT